MAAPLLRFWKWLSPSSSKDNMLLETGFLKLFSIIISAIFHMKIRIFLKIILAENRFFRIFGKTGPRIRNFFSLKPSCDQDRANKKKFSPIGPAVPELLSFRQTYIQTDKNAYYFVVLMYKICSTSNLVQGAFNNKLIS